MPIDKYSGNFAVKSLDGDVSLDSPTGYVLLSGETGITLNSRGSGYGVMLSTIDNSTGGEIWLKPSGDLQLKADDIAITSNNTYWTSDNTNTDSWRFRYPDKDAFDDEEVVLRVASQDQTLWSDGDLVIWSSGTVEIPNLKVSSSFLVDSGTDISFTTSGDFNINSGNKVYISSGASNSDDHDITLEAGDDINLKASDKIKLEADDGIEIEASSVAFDGSDVSGIGLLRTGGLMVGEIYAPNGIGSVDVISANSTGYALKVTNTSSYYNADGIQITINAAGAGSSNNWLQFIDGIAVRGAIQGTPEVSPFGAGYAVTSTAAVGQALFFTDISNAQFVSGNADFGEFFQLGDRDEWPEYTLKKSGVSGLPEGTVVWVRGTEFFRTASDGVGVPMLITKRALIVGNGRSLLKGAEEESLGEVLSFAGTLPVIIEGTANIGDLVLPTGVRNTCKTLCKKEASLQDYMMALGTALTSVQEPPVLQENTSDSLGETTYFGAILCAVGVK